MILNMRNQRIKDNLFGGLILGCGFDHQIRLPNIRNRKRCRYPAKRRGLIRVRDFPTFDLPRHIFVDPRQGLRQHILADIVQAHLISSQCHHVGDAVSHLTRANHPDFSYIHA